MNRELALEIYEELNKIHPDAQVQLDHETPYQLLVATILSAQCTDVRVNIITKDLFKAYPGPQEMVQLSQEGLEELIHSCGFYRNKAKNILATTRILLEDYGGEVPQTIEELVKLPGVGKKTANVVASVAFGLPAIAVDTHVFRVSNRLGLAQAKTVEKTEDQLQELFPPSTWSHLHHLLIFQGRKICLARKPKCEICSLKSFCKYYQQTRR
ncbi:MAG: endonuclease III [Tissierellia bacterium]|nr:endonuclease III [Tissierellia bacterium]